MALPTMFTPLQVGHVKLRNRFVMAPMVTLYAGEDGSVTRRLIDYYAARARGGAGLIIVEGTQVGPEEDIRRLRIDADNKIPGLNDLAESIQEHGARAVLQLVHNLKGHRFLADINGLSAQELDEICEQFAMAAVRAKKAGFDGVELHAAHGYLLSQFLSPLTNRRSDGLAGSLEQRLAYPLRVIRRVKEKAGDDFLLIVRFSANEFVPGGLGLDEALTVAKAFARAGLNALNISAGRSPETVHYVVQPMCMPRGVLVHLAEAIKKVVDIPVITVGRINDPLLAEEIVAAGKADLVAMGRGLLADPELPRKAFEGRFAEIRTCIACYWCYKRRSSYQPVKCAVNVEAGREREMAITPTACAKKVAVVGGGVAGLEAARVLSLRGHRVTVYEQGPELGGQVLLAAVPPNKQELQGIVSYLTTVVRQQGVTIRLNTKVTAQVLRQDPPEVVVLACGSSPRENNLPVAAGVNVLTAFDVLAMARRGEALPGRTIAVLGGGLIGCETAEYLAQAGKQVAIVSRQPEIARTEDPRPRALLEQRLREGGVTFHLSVRARAIVQGGVEVETERGDVVLVPAETVVLATGLVPNDCLREEDLAALGLVVLTVGERAARGGMIAHSIHAASAVARAI